MKRREVYALLAIAGTILVAIGLWFMVPSGWQVLLHCPPETCIDVMEHALDIMFWPAGPALLLGTVLLASIPLLDGFHKAHLRDEESSST